MKGIDTMNKTTSYEKILEAADDYLPLVNTVSFHDIDINVNRILPFGIFSNVVNGIADSCFDAVTGEYMPELREFATNIAIISAYTNIDLPTDDIEAQYALACGSGVVEVIKDGIDQNQLSELYYSVKKKIDIRNDANTRFFENEVSKAINTVDGIVGNFSAMFDGVSADDMKQMIQAIAEHGLDEGKLAEAVVKQQNELREKEGEIIQFSSGDNDGE